MAGKQASEELELGCGDQEGLLDAVEPPVVSVQRRSLTLLARAVVVSALAAGLIYAVSLMGSGSGSLMATAAIGGVQELDLRGDLNDAYLEMLAHNSIYTGQQWTDFKKDVKSYAAELGVKDAGDMKQGTSKTMELRKLVKSEGLYFDQGWYSNLDRTAAAYKNKWFYSNGFSPCSALFAWSNTKVFVAHIDEKKEVYKVVMKEFPKMGNTITVYMGAGYEKDSWFSLYEIMAAVDDLRSEGYKIEINAFYSVLYQEKVRTVNLFFNPDSKGLVYVDEASPLNIQRKLEPPNAAEFPSYTPSDWKDPGGTDIASLISAGAPPAHAAA